MAKIVPLIIAKSDILDLCLVSILGEDQLNRLVKLLSTVSKIKPVVLTDSPRIASCRKYDVIKCLDCSTTKDYLVKTLDILHNAYQLRDLDYVVITACNHVYEDLFSEIILNATRNFKTRNSSGIIIDDNLIISNYICAELRGENVIKLNIGHNVSKGGGTWTGIIIFKLHDLYKLLRDIKEKGEKEGKNVLDIHKILNYGLTHKLLTLKYYSSKGRAWWVLRSKSDVVIATYRLKLAISRRRFKRKRLYVFDLDGTLILGNRPAPGASQFIELIKDAGIEYKILSNNSSITPSEIASKLNTILFHGKHVIKESSIYTSVNYFIDCFYNELKESKAYILLPHHVIKYFRLPHNSKARYLDYNYVIVGFDTELTYEKLRKASLILQRNPKARYILLHPDIRCPVDEGFVPDAGSIASVITATSGRRPDWIGGKPSVGMLNAAAKGYNKGDVVFFGDRLYTDMKMAINAGIDFVLLLSGETKIEDVSLEILKNDNVYVTKDLREYAQIVHGARLGKVIY